MLSQALVSSNVYTQRQKLCLAQPIYSLKTVYCVPYKYKLNSQHKHIAWLSALQARIRNGKHFGPARKWCEVNRHDGWLLIGTYIKYLQSIHLYSIYTRVKTISTRTYIVNVCKIYNIHLIIRACFRRRNVFVIWRVLWSTDTN